MFFLEENSRLGVRANTTKSVFSDIAIFYKKFHTHYISENPKEKTNINLTITSRKKRKKIEEYGQSDKENSRDSH